MIILIQSTHRKSILYFLLYIKYVGYLYGGITQGNCPVIPSLIYGGITQGNCPVIPSLIYGGITQGNCPVIPLLIYGGITMAKNGGITFILAMIFFIDFFEFFLKNINVQRLIFFQLFPFFCPRNGQKMANHGQKKPFWP